MKFYINPSTFEVREEYDLVETGLSVLLGLFGGAILAGILWAIVVGISAFVEGVKTIN